MVHLACRAFLSSHYSSACSEENTRLMASPYWEELNMHSVFPISDRCPKNCFLSHCTKTSMTGSMVNEWLEEDQRGTVKHSVPYTKSITSYNNQEDLFVNLGFFLRTEKLSMFSVLPDCPTDNWRALGAWRTLERTYTSLQHQTTRRVVGKHQRKQ